MKGRGEGNYLQSPGVLQIVFCQAKEPQYLHTSGGLNLPTVHWHLDFESDLGAEAGFGNVRPPMRVSQMQRREK